MSDILSLPTADCAVAGVFQKNAGIKDKDVGQGSFAFMQRWPEG